jgi:hypothetical protein
VAFWLGLFFILGLLAGSAATWWLLDGRVVAPSQLPPPHPTPEPAEDVPDSMSLSARRLVSDLERKYEGITSAGEDEEAKPKRPRAKRTRRPAPEDPA